MSDRILEVLTALPQSTGAWSCRYFMTIVFLSLVLVALGATIIPGVFGIFAMCLGCLSAGLTVGMRDPSQSKCDL